MKKGLFQSLQPLSSRLSLDWLVRMTGQRLILPFYHSVKSTTPLPHIKHLYPVRSLKQFEQDLDFFLKHYQPISLEDLFGHLQSGEPFKKNRFFLSFDDGLRSFYDWIAPLLLKKGIPATVFLNSAFVDNQDLFFRYKASLILDHPDVEKIASKEDILSISYSEKHLLDQYAQSLGLDFQDFLQSYQPYLSSIQIKNLSEQGFTFGSHSIDHPLYNQLPEEEQIRQTQKSQAFIDQNFPQRIKAFAFPFTDHGVKASFFKKIQEDRIIDISFGTAGLKLDSTSFHLQRIPMEAFTASAMNQVNSAYTYFGLKRLINKNRIQRD